MGLNRRGTGRGVELHWKSFCILCIHSVSLRRCCLRHIHTQEPVASSVVFMGTSQNTLRMQVFTKQLLISPELQLIPRRISLPSPVWIFLGINLEQPLRSSQDVRICWFCLLCVCAWGPGVCTCASVSVVRFACVWRSEVGFVYFLDSISGF